MAKQVTENQCDLFHQHFAPDECCLCEARARVKQLEFLLTYANREWDAEIHKAQDFQRELNTVRAEFMGYVEAGKFKHPAWQKAVFPIAPHCIDCRTCEHPCQYR
jgi:hypothetical protein